MKHKSNLDLEGSLGVKGQATNNEVVLDGSDKDVDWDWSGGNSFILTLQKSVTIHTPTSIPSQLASQVNLVIKQNPLGFYKVTWSKQFKWPDGAPVQVSQKRDATDLLSFHVSPVLGQRIILGVGAKDFFYL